MFIKDRASTHITEIRDIRVKGAELYVNDELFDTLDSPAQAQEELLNIAQSMANMDDFYDLNHNIEYEDEEDEDEEDVDFAFGPDDDTDGDEDDDYTFPESSPVEQEENFYLDPMSNLVPFLDDDQDPDEIRYAALIMTLRSNDMYDQGDIYFDYLTDSDYTHYRKEELKGNAVILKLYEVHDGKLMIPKK